MYLRLVVTRRDEESSRRQGVFTSAYELLDGGTVEGEERERLSDLISWFERNLPPPDRSRLVPRSLFWFRPGTDRLVRKLWDLAAILREHGYHVELLKTARPGVICYQDTYQVAAMPFRDGRIG